MTKTVLITGCSSGIGQALSLAMHEAGYNVYSSGRRMEKLALLREKGIKTLSLDVTDAASISQAMAEIEHNNDWVDILINNAGYGAMGPLVEMPESELEQQFRTNVYGPLYLSRACLPHMRKRGSGLIVNVGSVSGIMVTPFSGAYCATKAALHALSDALRMELSPFDIQVMTVQPGAIESEFGNNAEDSLSRTFADTSAYQTVRSGVLKRARMSQSKPTPTAEFVNQLLATIRKPKPPAVVKIGNGSTLFPIMARCLPTRLNDYILQRTFGLDDFNPTQ